MAQESMQKMETTADNVMKWINGGVWILVAGAILVCGIMCIAGSDEGRTKAKKWFPWILIGSVLILGAKEIANAIVNTISF